VSTLEQLQRELALFLITPANAQIPANPSIAVATGDSSRSSTSATPGASGLLNGLAPEQLQQARETLFRKRRAQTKSLLPRTAAMLEEQYTPLFRVYSTEQHYSGYRAPLLDAVGFSRWLAIHRKQPAWLQDVAAWEAWPIRLVLLPRRLHWMYLRWDVCQERQAKPYDHFIRRRSLCLGYRGQGQSVISYRIKISPFA
jgi:hypothetical protein